MSIWLPPDLGLDIAYSKEDFELFRDTVCEEIGLPTLKKIIEKNSGSPRLTKSYIYEVSQGHAYNDYGIYTEPITDGQKKYHEQLFNIMYKVPLEDVPLYVNDDCDVTPVVRWRLKIAK